MMRERLSIFGDVLLVYGRLKLGRLAFVGAVSAAVVSGGVSSAMVIGWFWKTISGAPLIPGHELLGGGLDISALLVLPIAALGFLLAKGRLTLSAEDAEARQEQWHETHWALWNANGTYSISSASFVMSMVGALTLICLVAGLFRIAVEICGAPCALPPR